MFILHQDDHPCRGGWRFIAPFVGVAQRTLQHQHPHGIRTLAVAPDCGGEGEYPSIKTNDKYPEVPVQAQGKINAGDWYQQALNNLLLARTLKDVLLQELVIKQRWFSSTRWRNNHLRSRRTPTTLNTSSGRQQNACPYRNHMPCNLASSWQLHEITGFLVAGN